MEVWELIAREEIRDTLARYAQYADSGLFDQLAQLFAADGVMAIDGREPMQGPAAIRDFLGATRSRIAATAQRPYIRHHVSSIVIEIHSPDTATASSYFLAITQNGPDHWGRYRDELVRKDDRWLFTKRRVRLDGRASAP